MRTSIRSRRPTSAKSGPERRLVRLLRQARRAGIHEPEAMTLATTGPGGRPSARVVLLRGLDERGLVFFTNYQSRKGRELARHPHAALVFYWPQLGHQVRVEGRVTRLTGPESDDYFASRPRAARLAAWASDQSKVIRDRKTLLDRYALALRRFRNRDVPRPPHWGGFRLEPRVFEFWRVRPHRLHDRLRHARRGRTWNVERLAP